MQTKNDKTKLINIIKQSCSIDIVYDCGSRDALDGIELIERTNAKELHIFECNPFSYEVCKTNSDKFLGTSLIKVYLNSVALSSSTGSIDFYPINTERTITSHKDGNPGASSLFRVNNKYKKERYVQDRLTVPTTTLDEYCKTHKPPDLLWMDLQGAELMALKGAGHLLDKVKIIHLEIGFRQMYQGQPLFWEVDNFLRNKSFKRADLDLGRWPEWLPLYRLFRTGPWIGNAIYINPNQIQH